MTIQPAPRTVTLTIWKLEADMIDITKMGGTYKEYAMGYIHAHARGGGIEHRIRITLADQVRIGDTYTIDIQPPRAGDDAPREPVGPNPGVPETGRHRKDRR